MSVLLPIVAAEIKAKGPLSIARYMGLALGHETYGYYTKQDPFGVQGDFITSPEISQMFGEMIGLWCAFVGQSISPDDPLILLELGPGRGTLMADALRAAKSVPGFLDRVSVALVETSPVLKAQQKETLAAFDVSVTWYDSIKDVADGPLLVIGNEFFDALPICQYVKTADGWLERLVGLGEDESTLVFVMSKAPAAETLIPQALLEKAEVADVYEDQAVSRHMVTEAAKRIKKFGGAAVFVDYGHDQHGLGDTFQALRNHQYVDVLANPGDQDLTAHVDFEQLANAAVAVGVNVFPPMPQGLFLESLGLRERAEGLKKSATEEQVFDVNRAYGRLTNPEQMGSLFRVLAMSSAGIRVPPWA